ncbi:hypothetical protein SNEBB_010627 [Seison nebaliae]|nr:hypothetical protein SNEBB_010627 [Seison nebaliae]
MLNGMYRVRKGFDKVFEVKFLPKSDNCYSVAEMTVKEEHTNHFGVLHGGMTATLIDMLSSWTLVASNHHKAGISIKMDIEYLKLAKMGEKIRIHSKVLECNELIATMHVDIKNARKESIAKGLHLKYVGNDSYEEFKKYAEQFL